MTNLYCEIYILRSHVSEIYLLVYGEVSPHTVHHPSDRGIEPIDGYDQVVHVHVPKRVVELGQFDERVWVPIGWHDTAKQDHVPGPER